MWLKIVWEIATEKQRGCLQRLFIYLFIYWGGVIFLSSFIHPFKALRSPFLKILQLFPTPYKLFVLEWPLDPP